MNERLYPDGFLESYRAAFQCDPPEEFCEAYELLADGLYFGLQLEREEDGGSLNRKGRSNGDLFFREPRLWGAKLAVDRRITQAARALRAWQTHRARQARRGLPPQAARRGHLVEVGRDGRAEPDTEDEEA